MPQLPDYQKMQTKTARYHFVSIRLAKIRNPDNAMYSGSPAWAAIWQHLVKLSTNYLYDPEITILGLEQKDCSQLFLWGNISASDQGNYSSSKAKRNGTLDSI